MSNQEKQTSDKKPNKVLQWNQTYFTICVYTLILILAACIVIRLVYHWDETFKIILNFFSHLSSFMFGILIAFMVNPLVRYIHTEFLEKELKLKNKKVIKGLSILITYVLVFGFLAICLVYVIPQLIESVSELSTSIPYLYYKFGAWLRSIAYSNDFLSNDLVNKLISSLSPKIMDLSTTLASKFIPWLYSASIAIIHWLVTFVIAVMISIYLLIDKKEIFRTLKRVLYAFLPKNMVHHSIEIAKNCNRIFSGYIVAKAIDSLIIGILCFILMAILRLPYTILISVIVGITNMIPYFGPYIGAIPGLFLLMVIKFKYGVIFLIMIFALQQFDGLILGPRILGDSTGLRPILILFAITLGGAYAGVLGMFLGVPVIAVIQYLLNLLIEKRLKDRKIDL